MSCHPTNFQGSVVDAIKEAIEGRIANSQALVSGGGGHFSIDVTSPMFAGKGMLESQRMVYGATPTLWREMRHPSMPWIA